MATTIFLIFLTLLFSAMFSGIEIAFLSANKLKIELSYQRGTLSGKILNDYIKNPSKFIVTTLLGNNIALISFGILFASLIEPFLEPFRPSFQHHWCCFSESLYRKYYSKFLQILFCRLWRFRSGCFTGCLRPGYYWLQDYPLYYSKLSV